MTSLTVSAPRVPFHVPWREGVAQGSKFSDQACYNSGHCDISTVRRLHRQVTGVEAEVDRRVAERDAPYFEQLQQLRAALDAALAELAQVTKERNSLNDKIPFLKTFIQKLEGKLGDEQAAHMKTREEFVGFQHNAKLKQTELQDKVKDQAAELAYAAEEKASLQGTITDLNDQLLKETAKVTNLKAELRDTCNKLQTEKDARAREVASLSNRLTELQEEFQSEMDKANKKMSEMSRIFEHEKHQLVLALEKEKLEHANDIMVKEEEIAELKKAHAKQVAALEKMISHLEATVAERDEEIARMKAAHAEAIADLEAKLAWAIEAKILAERETQRLKELLDSQLGRGHSWQNTQRWVREEMGLPH